MSGGTAAVRTDNRHCVTNVVLDRTGGLYYPIFMEFRSPGTASITMRALAAALLLACAGAAAAESGAQSLAEAAGGAAVNIPPVPPHNISAAPDASAETRSYDLLKTEADLEAEYCANDFHVVVEHSGCSTSHKQVLRIPFPRAAAAVIAAHVSQLERHAYFTKMDPADFFHGHFIIYGKTRQYASLQDFLGDITGYLYHTAEYTDRWSDAEGSLPISKKTPRSLLGKPDGSLIKAINAIAPKYRHSPAYEKGGTLYSADIVESNPKMSRLSWSFGAPEDVTLAFKAEGRSGQCTIDSQFYIRLRPDGRFKLADGRPYDMYILCELDARTE